MATIRDVARAAGVSITTVSTALNGSGRVADDTRRRVWAAAEAVGYAPNAVARSLRMGTSRLIAMMVGDLTNPFIGALIMAAERRARAAGFAVIVATIDEDPGHVDATLKRLCAQHVAGIVIMPTASGPKDRERLADPTLPPLVMLDHKVPGLERDFVGVDNRAAVRVLVEHLVALGHRRIAMISGRPGLWTADERCRGFARAMRDAGLRVGRCIRADYRGASGHAAARALLGRPERPTAIIGANNVIALGILQACVDAGLECPADVSVAGIDDVPWSGLVRPRITTVAQPVEQLAACAMEWLLDRIEGKDRGRAPRERLFRPSFIPGESCLDLRAATSGEGTLSRREA